jgi:hypothetical protein
MCLNLFSNRALTDCIIGFHKKKGCLFHEAQCTVNLQKLQGARKEAYKSETEGLYAMLKYLALIPLFSTVFLIWCWIRILCIHTYICKFYKVQYNELHKIEIT